jgi:hypothetical protein
MDTLTLRALVLAIVDAPLAPALGLLTGAGMALLALTAVLGTAAWVRFFRTPGVRPGGETASLLAWRAGRLGLAALGLALGGRALLLAAAPRPDGAAALWWAVGAVVLVRARGAWTLWATVLPAAPIPGPAVAADVHRIATAIARWDREATGEVTTLASQRRMPGPAPAGPPRTHRLPDV